MIFKICLFLIFIKNTFQENHVKVAVYYESLQDTSKQALITSIMPGYEKLKDEVNFEFELFPYGRSTEEGGNLKCPQGDKECLANKIQACVLAENGSLYNKMMFVKCAMKQDDPSDTLLLNVCIKYWTFDIKRVQECYQGTQGNRLLEDYGKKTSNIPKIKDHIPVIIFNDNFDEKKSIQARDHFVYVVCEMLDNSPPASCASLEKQIDNGYFVLEIYFDLENSRGRIKTQFFNFPHNSNQHSMFLITCIKALSKFIDIIA